MTRLQACLWAALAADIAIFVTACASQPAKLPPPAPVQAVACLPMRQYSKAQQQEAAAELAKLPSDSVVAQMVIDYGQLRDADRACQSSK